jgi:hypothetical protein
MNHETLCWVADQSSLYSLKCQYSSEALFDTAWYGTYKLSPDQPDPTPNSTLFPPEIYVRP